MCIFFDTHFIIWTNHLQQNNFLKGCVIQIFWPQGRCSCVKLDLLEVLSSLTVQVKKSISNNESGKTCPGHVAPNHFFFFFFFPAELNLHWHYFHDYHCVKNKYIIIIKNSHIISNTNMFTYRQHLLYIILNYVKLKCTRAAPWQVCKWGCEGYKLAVFSVSML